MPYSEKPYEMPCVIDAAAWNADKMVELGKTKPIGIFASGNGKPTVNFYNEDGSSTLVAFFDGNWHEYVEVADG